MSIESVQFTELVRTEYARIELAQLEHEQVLVRIALAELDGEITADEATQARASLSSAPYRRDGGG